MKKWIVMVTLACCVMGCAPDEKKTSPANDSAEKVNDAVQPKKRSVKPEPDTIFAAAANGQLATVMRFLHEEHDVNAQDEDGMTALAWASFRGRSAVARYLLEHNADPNIPDKKGLTPLHKACLFGDKAVIQTLVDFKADVNASGPEGLKALKVAKRMNHTDAIAILEAAGAVEE